MESERFIHVIEPEIIDNISNLKEGLDIVYKCTKEFYELVINITHLINSSLCYNDIIFVEKDEPCIEIDYDYCITYQSCEKRPPESKEKIRVALVQDKAKFSIQYNLVTNKLFMCKYPKWQYESNNPYLGISQYKKTDLREWNNKYFNETMSKPLSDLQFMIESALKRNKLKYKR